MYVSLICIWLLNISNTIKMINNYGTQEFLKKASLNKNITLKELDQTLATFQKILSTRHLIQQTYPIFINLFLSSQQHLPVRTEIIFKIFYILIKTQDQTQHKILIFIHNMLEICEKRQQEIQDQKCLKNMLILVKKGAEKQWGAETVDVFLKYYHQRLQQFLKPKDINLSYLKELSLILTPKYRLQYTQFMIKLSKNKSKSLSFKILLLMQIKNHPQLLINILKQIELPMKKEEVKDQYSTLAFTLWIQCLAIFLQFHQHFNLLVPLFSPISFLSIPKDFPQVLHQIIIITYLQNKRCSTQPINLQSFITYLKENIDDINTIRLGAVVYYYCQQSSIIINQMKQKTQQNNLIFLNQTLQMINYEEDIIITMNNQKIIHYLSSDCSIEDVQWVKELKQQNLNEVISALLYQNLSYEQNKNQQTHTFPNLSYELFNCININPKCEIKQLKREKLQNQPITQLKCIKVLGLLVKNFTTSTVIPLLKKSILTRYDKINQYTIRQNIHNAFLMKSLIATSLKVKTVCENLLKNYQEEDIFFIFPNIPRLILMEYVRYLATKDKFKFKLQLYEKNLIQYQFILRDPTFKYLFI